MTSNLHRHFFVFSSNLKFTKVCANWRSKCLTVMKDCRKLLKKVVAQPSNFCLFCNLSPPHSNFFSKNTVAEPSFPDEKKKRGGSCISRVFLTVADEFWLEFNFFFKKREKKTPKHPDGFTRPPHFYPPPSETIFFCPPPQKKRFEIILRPLGRFVFIKSSEKMFYDSLCQSAEHT